jgi:hypothetical protein
MRSPPDKRRPAPLAGGNGADSQQTRQGHHIAVPQRAQRLAQHLHGLGARAIYEFIAEIASVYGDGVIVRIERYATLDRDILAVTGGDRFPPPPLRRVL